MELLETMCIYASIMAMKTRERVKSFLESQSGVSNVVATIIILLIVVLIIGVFWKQLQKWLNGMMQTIFGTSFDANDLSNGLPS